MSSATTGLALLHSSDHRQNTRKKARCRRYPNSHLLNTHHYHLAAASYVAAQPGSVIPGCCRPWARSTTLAREAMVEGGRPEREVVALGEVLRLRGGLHVQLRRRSDVAGPFVEVGGRSGVPRECRVELRERGEPRLRPIRLTDGDGAIEPHNRAVGEPDELVVPLDDLHPVGLFGC